MVIQLPILWATLLYIIGIVMGGFFPSQIYIMLMLAILAGIAFFRKREHLTDLLTACFWLMFGAARICMPNIPDNTLYDNMIHNIQKKAKEANTELIHRLEETGLEGESLAISSALLLGNKQSLEWDTKHAFALVGASHLLALSGMHLGILYGLLYFFFIHRMRYSRWKWLTLLPTLLCIWGYAFLAGLPISLVRASIMLSFITIASLSQSQHSSLHILALSALLILIYAPEELFSISFQLSFVATFFILVLYRPVANAFYHKTRNYVLWIFVMSLIAQLGTMPLTIYYFHSLPLLGSVISVVLVPLTTIVIYSGVLTLLVPCSFFASVLSWLIRGEMYIIDVTGKIPYTTVNDLYPEWWQIALMYALLLCLTFRAIAYLDQKEP